MSIRLGIARGVFRCLTSLSTIEHHEFAQGRFATYGFLHVAFATTDVGRVLTTVRFNASSLSCLLFVSAVTALTWTEEELSLAVYGLSFWHYYLYGLAFRFGEISLTVFKRDAVVMKSVSLVLCGYIYLLTPANLASAAVIVAGFLLNGLAARQLGSDRTYYGYELADLPFRRITRFPYSWTSHPMLIGNMTSFGGMLLNNDFRPAWGPLACVHVAMNAGLLSMELFVKPLRLAVQRGDETVLRQYRDGQPMQDVLFLLACAAAGAGFGFWSAQRANDLLSASLGASVFAYAWFMYRCYTAPVITKANVGQPEDIG